MNDKPVMKTYCPRCKKTWTVYCEITLLEPWEARTGERDAEDVEAFMTSCEVCGGETQVTQIFEKHGTVREILDDMRKEEEQ